MTQHDADTIRIHTPCPMKWEELVGDDRRRYCDSCALHVLNGSRLARAEARALITNATERVCMRLEIDARGEPLFADTPPAPVRTPARGPALARPLQWAASLVGVLLAACTRAAPESISGTPVVQPCTTNTTHIVGKVAPIEVLGDVADPRSLPPPARIEKIGEVGPDPVANTSPAQDDPH